MTYNVGIPTTAELKWTLMRLGYEWDRLRVHADGFCRRVHRRQVQQGERELTASLVAPQTFERNVPVPTIGGIARGYLTQFVSFTGEFTGAEAEP